jgi:hypothetical protein
MHSLQLGGPFFQLILEAWSDGCPPAPLSSTLPADDEGDGMTALRRFIRIRKCAVGSTIDSRAFRAGMWMWRAQRFKPDRTLGEPFRPNGILFRPLQDSAR